MNGTKSVSDIKKVLPRGEVGAELMIITESPLESSAAKLAAAVAADHPQASIMVFDYSMFIIEKPLHVIWSRHEIMTKAEVRDLLASKFTTLANLPTILTVDPGCVWCGARDGDVLRIHRISEIAGIAYGYRVVRSV